jgi:hypothetical protein
MVKKSKSGLRTPIATRPAALSQHSFRASSLFKTFDDIKTNGDGFHTVSEIHTLSVSDCQPVEFWALIWWKCDGWVLDVLDDIC